MIQIINTAKMKKALLFLFLITLQLPCYSQIKPNNVSYQKRDSIDVINIINEAKKLPLSTNRFLFIARKFIGRPYVAHTLEINNEEKLVVNVREVDCTTFVEYVLAIEQCLKNKKYSFADFCNYLVQIRYIKGNVDYTSRQHYFTLWIKDNTEDGFVKEINTPNPPFTNIQTVNVNYMTTHVSSYRMLNLHKEWVKQIRALEQSINGKRYRYIPKSRISNTQLLRKTIKTGDILAIVCNKKGLDIAHLGIAVWKKDGLHLLNASSIHKKVVEEPMTLRKYLYKHPSHLGIRVIKVK